MGQLLSYCVCKLSNFCLLGKMQMVYSRRSRPIRDGDLRKHISWNHVRVRTTDDLHVCKEQIPGLHIDLD
jgi:hypothetical protein